MGKSQIILSWSTENSTALGHEIIQDAIQAAHLTSSLFFHPSLKHHMNHSLSPIAKES